MKHKSLLKKVFGLSIALVFGLFMSSCGDDNPAPTLTLVNNGVDGFTVDIAAEATHADTWHWDYGDGNTSEKVGGHFYTYSERGDYTITCTVTGQGGSVTKSIDVHIATLDELLARSWQLSNSGNNGIGFLITPDLPLTMPLNDILDALNGLRGEDEDYDFTVEYDDVYNFSSNGTMDISTNGSALSPWVYAAFSADKVLGSCEAAGFAAIGLDDVKTTGWKIHTKETIVVNTVQDQDKDGGPDDINDDGVIDENDIVPVKLEDIDFISFTNGGYLGIKDYGVTDGTTSYDFIAIINSISTDEMNVTVLAHMAVAGQGIGINEPCYSVKMTFKAVQ